MLVVSDTPRIFFQALVLLTVVGACVDPTVEEPGIFVASYTGVHAYPVGNLHLAAGPEDELVIQGAAFALGGVPYRVGPLDLPPRGSWPVRAVLLSSAGDTLATARTTISLRPGHKLSIGVIAYPNLRSWFVCSPIVARVPIPGPGTAPDTLYMLASNEPISDLPPPPC